MDRANQPTLAGSGVGVPPPGWASGAGPLHLRLAGAIDRLISEGELASGAALPTERELARRASVSRATAAGAYRHLKAAGRIDSRQGRGTWVAPLATGRRPTAGGIGPVLAHPDHAIDLSLAAAEPSPELWASIDDALGRARSSLAGVGYEPAGLPALRDALGGRSDELLVTTGAQQAISLVFDELVSPGDTVVVEEVTYVGALDAARRCGARLVAVPSGAEGVDVDALVAAVERHQPVLVYLNPTHQSPTGSVLPDAARARVVDLAVRTATPVVDDTSLAALAFDGARRPRPLRSFDPGAPVITIGSFSKTVWAGLRVGWLRAEPRMVERLVQRRMVADLGGSMVSQAVVLALLDQLPRIEAQRAAELAVRHAHLRELLGREIPDWSPAPAAGGTSAWVRLPGDDALELATVAAERGVHLVAGPSLSAHGRGADHVRLSVGPSVEVLDEAVLRLAAAWADHLGRRRRIVV